MLPCQHCLQHLPVKAQVPFACLDGGDRYSPSSGMENSFEQMPPAVPELQLNLAARTRAVRGMQAHSSNPSESFVRPLDLIMLCPVSREMMGALIMLLQTFWHSSAHVLGEALESCFGAKLTIGPALEEGFYYDCYLGDRTLTEADRPVLQRRIEEACPQLCLWCSAMCRYPEFPVLYLCCCT